MDLAEHADHKWEQHGRCVWCETCNVRLYQGTLPAPGKQKEDAATIDIMLATARTKFEAKVKKEWDERTPEQEAVYEEGRDSYVSGESIMDRMKRENPHKETPLAAWFNRGWTNAEFAYYESQQETDA